MAKPTSPLKTHLVHKHLIVNATISNPPTNTKQVRGFLIDLIESIGMKVAELGEGQANPIAWYSGDPENQGMTASAILTTSHCALHVWDLDKTLRFDLYSCAEFEVTKVLEKINELFGLVTEEYHIYDRDKLIRRDN